MRFIVILAVLFWGEYFFNSSLQAAPGDADSSSYTIRFTPKSAENEFTATVSAPRQRLTIQVKRFGRFDDQDRTIKAIPLSNEAFLIFDRKGPLFIPKMYAALAHFTGPCDEDYDDFKGNFSFKFSLEVNKNGLESRYVYWLHQQRSMIDVLLYQLVSERDQRSSDTVSIPNEALFSRLDVNVFTNRFFDYFVKEAERARYVPPPFILTVPSNFLISGYLLGAGYFSKEYQEQDVYEAKVQDYLSRIKGLEKKSSQQDESRPNDESQLREQQVVVQGAPAKKDEENLSEGEAKGGLELRREIAERLRKRRMALPAIAEVVGLPLNEVEPLMTAPAAASSAPTSSAAAASSSSAPTRDAKKIHRS